MPQPLQRTIAFWISPDAEIYVVPTTHIQFAIDHHQLFNLSLEKLKQLYLDHGEPFGCEGEARNQTIAELVKQGWIRVRRYRQEYSCNVPDLKPETRHRIGMFVTQLLTDGFDGKYEADRYQTLKITSFDDLSVSLMSLSEAASYQQTSTNPPPTQK